MLKMASLFDGIGGFPLASIRHGIKPVWASEIEAFPIEVTKHHFPEMLHFGDITKLNGANLPPVDIVTGGSPCQDLSVAGNRAGLAGERSGLFMEQIRIIKEMRREDERKGRTANLIRPRYMVWENVPGAFSSADSEDFRAVLEETGRIVDNGLSIPRPPGGAWKSAGAILGDEFSIAWRVLDTQYWPGTPQRRRRIFLIADFAGHSAGQILFEQDRLFGNTSAGGGPWQGASPATPSSADDTGGDNGCLTPWDVMVRALSAESTGDSASLHRGAPRGRDQSPRVPPCSPREQETILTAFACNQRDEVRDLGDCAGALQAQPGMKQQTFVAAPVMCLSDQGGNRMDLTDDVTTTLRANMGGHQPLVIPINTQIATRHQKLGEGTGFGVGENGDPAYTLQEAHSHGVFLGGTDCMTPWDTQQERIFTPNGVSPTLAGADGGGGRNPAGLVYAAGVVTKGNGDCFITPEVHTSLTKGGGQAGQGYPCVLAAGFCAGAAPTAGNIGYQEECSPTLKAAESGTNMVPAVLCLNDQGGQRMDISKNITGTLRAQMDSHQPLVMATQQGGAEICEDLCPTITASSGMSGNNQPVLFENHGIDSRYTGPHDVAPTMSARYGTGGNNTPLISQEESYCIAGNIIDREVQNGGNGFGYQANISYTLNCADRHAVYAQQRSDEYAESPVSCTQAARQYKDATDLVCDVAGLDCRNMTENGDLCGTLQSKTTGGYSLNNVHPIRTGKLIRRLLPIECERLQGFPDRWTEIGNGSDSARYKALGNSVAIPCVEFIMRGIAYFMYYIMGNKECE